MVVRRVQSRKLNANRGHMLPEMEVRKGVMGNTPRALGVKPKLKVHKLKNRM